MNLQAAKALADAYALSGHPRLDYRTEEARKQTVWMEEYLRPYIRRGARLLDLGCGCGKQTLKAQSMGVRAIGLDCSTRAVAFARQVAAAIGSQAEFVAGAYEQLPFADDSFDTVIFPKNIVECSYAEVEVLGRQVRRILRVDGRFILTMKDCLLQRREGRGEEFTDSNPIVGCSRGQVSIPGAGTFDYPTYRWTVALARHSLGRWFSGESFRRMPGDEFLLVFRKGEM